MKSLILIFAAAFSQQAFCQDLIASRCEAFVDKAIHQKHNDGRNYSNDLSVFIKVSPRLMSLGVRNVVFYSDLNRHEWPSGSRTEPFQTKALKPFANASDYFEITLATSGGDADAGGMTNSFKGAFYVEVGNGDRYWINPASGGNFTIDDTTTNNIVTGSFDPGAVSWSPRTLPVGDYPKTADIGRGTEGYLNPMGCR